MANIFQTMGAQKSNSVLNQIGQLKQMLQGKDPNAVMQLMMQRNPQFAQFAQECKGMNAEEICNKYGVDFNTVRNVLGNK